MVKVNIMMKLYVLLLFLVPCIYAQDSFTLELGNDLITDASTDRYLTNTFAIKIKRKDLPNLLKRFLPDIEADHFIAHIGQDMYTPEDIGAEIPDPNDRPYAGHTFVEFQIVQNNENRFEFTTLKISIIGPLSMAKEVQGVVHDWTKSTKPNGWDTQLANELGIQIGKIWGHKTELYNRGLIRIENMTYATAALGNVKTFAGVGSKFVAGYNPPNDFDFLDFKSNQEQSSKWSAYISVDLRQNYVMRDIFIDGNSAWFGERTNLKREDFVRTLDTSLVTRYGNWFFKYTYSYQTEQFVGQNGPTKFGTISLEYRQNTDVIGKRINRLIERIRN